MHAVARLVLDPVITNIQASWVKMGPDGARVLLDAGGNDLGGVLMNEFITRAAGAMHGQEMTPPTWSSSSALGRLPRQRTTLYGDRAAAKGALPRRSARVTRLVRPSGAGPIPVSSAGWRHSDSRY